jgi:hypothetical protein
MAADQLLVQAGCQACGDHVEERAGAPTAEYPGRPAGNLWRMDAGQEVPAEPVENPAAVADAEQHVRQELRSLRARLAGRTGGYVAPLAAAAGIVVSGWLIRHWRRKR